MPQRRIPFRTTATACLLVLAALLIGSGVAQAKILISPSLQTENAGDTFTCTFQNVHAKATAGVAFLIWDFISQQVVAEDAFLLPAGSVAIYSVPGPGLFECVVQTKGGKVRTYVSFGADGRSTEVLQVE
jgi:hypothetical protein